MKETASYGFHKAFYKSLIPPFCLFLKSRMNLVRPKKPELPENYLLISNHVTNYDPFILGVILRRQMYYVATEHLFSLGFKTRCIRYLADPIPRPKGGNAAGAVMEILRRLKSGRSVCLFAEGNTSWDGCTAAFPEATGKMIRSSRVSLVTFRIEGGYFSNPRWGYSFRKGRVTGNVVHVYSPEELRSMSPEEINALVARDIFEDAYARQEKEPIAYRGRDLSRGLEHVLVLCPKCRRLGTLKSDRKGFSCSCGLKGSMDAYGRLAGEGFDFTGIRDWDAWQKAAVEELPEDGSELVRDKDMVLLKIENHRRRETGRGDIALSSKSFTAGGQTWPLTELASLEIRLHGVISFSLKDGSYFELKKADGSDYSGRKYKLLFDRFAGSDE